MKLLKYFLFIAILIASLFFFVKLDSMNVVGDLLTLDPNSPKVVDDEWGNRPYHELENIEHFTLMYSDQSFKVTEITGEDDKFGAGINELANVSDIILSPF